MKMPLVSICIPAYNHEKYIVDALESVVNLDYDNMEIFIIDDCSTDKTYDIILQYKNKLEKKFKNVYINKNEVNCGVIFTMNLMFNMSKGEYIKVFSSDDMLCKNCIKSLVEFFEKNRDSDIVCSRAYVIDEHIKYSDIDMINSSNTKIFPSEINIDYNMDDMFVKNYLSSLTVMFKKETLKKYGGYNSKMFFEDYQYWLNLLSCGGKIAFLDKPTVCYRELKNSLCHGKIYSEKRANGIISDAKILVSDFYKYVKDKRKAYIGVRNKIISAIMVTIYTKKFNCTRDLLAFAKKYGVKYNFFDYFIWTLKGFRFYIFKI